MTGARFRLGLVSDTHGRLHPRLAEVFAGVDRIVHAGDVGGKPVLDALLAIAPVTAVKGNYDLDPELAGLLLPDPSLITLGGLPAFLTHRLITIDFAAHAELIASLLAQTPIPPRLFIFGHTHDPVLTRVGELTFVNPGYCGPDPLEGPPSVALIEIQDGEVQGRIVRL